MPWLRQGQSPTYGQRVYNAGMRSTSGRWDFRVAPQTDDLVRRAAETADASLTDFVVDAAVLQAERVLADRTRFELGPAQWKRFVAILDRQPRDNPRLRRLFDRKSIFEAD